MSTARPSLSPTNSIDTTSFLSHRNHRLVRRTLSLRCGVRFLRRASNNHMMRVREAAAEQLEERQSDWAYSRPIVILDLVWNFAFLVGATVVFEVSKEAPGMPLRLWIFGYAVQCMIHMVCVSFEYNRRRRQHIIGSDDNVNLQHCGGGSSSGGGGWWRRLNSNSSMESDERDSRDYIPESSPQVEDETRYNR